MPESPTKILYPEIDYDRSISRQRIVYKLTGGMIFSYIFDNIAVLIFMTLAFIPTYAKLKGGHTSILAMFCGISFICWMISNILFRETVVKIKDINIAQRKKDIISVLNHFYKNLDFQVNEENMIRSFKDSYHPIWGRIITVLFNDDVIYLNITKLGKSDSPTSIHGLASYLKARRIARYFKSHIR